MKGLCVILDCEADYAWGFMDWINRRKTLPFDGAACTSKESLLSYAQQHPIDILLVAESMMEEEIEKIPAQSRIILNEGLGSEACRAGPQVCKYRACDELLREVMEIYSEADHALNGSGMLLCGKMETVGVYDPSGGSGSLAFSLAMGQVLAEQQKVLFLDLSAFSGIVPIFEMNNDRGVADLIYYQEHGGKDLGSKLSGTVCERLGMDMIPPALSPEDLYGIPDSKWTALFDGIAKTGIYEEMILHLGFPSFLLLDCCSRIYIPEPEKAAARIRTDSFFTTLEKSRYRELKQRIIRVPGKTAEEVTPDLLKTGPAFGKLGKTVRALAGERNIK